jgi:hypothetical protein
VHHKQYKSHANPLPSPHSKQTQSPSSLGASVTCQICGSRKSWTNVPHGDTPQALYPCVYRSWLMGSDIYRPSYAECRCDDSLHTQSRQQIPLHSYASNSSNARRSRSVPSIIVYTLVPYTTYLSLITFKIIPHPMTLLTAFPLQIIILHLI